MLDNSEKVGTKRTLVVWMMLAMLVAAGTRAAAEKPADLIKQLTGKTEAPQRSAEQWQKAYQQALDHLLPKLSAKDRFKLYDPQMTLEAMTTHAHRKGAETQHAALSEVLCDKLADDQTPMEARLWIAQKMINFAEADAVPTLKKLLDHDNKHLAERARQALQHNPSDQARQALIEALKGMPSENKLIALINALAGRDDPSVSDALFSQAKAKSSAVANAAVRAIGRVGDAGALKKLNAYEGHSHPHTEAVRAEAQLEIASRLARAGRHLGMATGVFDRLYRKAPSEALRAAALKQKLVYDSADSAELYATVLTGDSLALKQAALHAGREAEGEAATKALAETLDRLDPLMQQRVLSVLTERGDPAALQSIAQLIGENGSESTAVKKQAIRAIGALNTTESAKKLLPFAVNDREGLGETAAETIAQMPSEQVTQMLDRLAREAAPAKRVAIFRIRAMRPTPMPMDMVLTALKSDHGPLSQQARRVLVQQASPDQLDRLIAALEKTDSGRARHFIVQAIRSALGQSSNPTAYEKPILQAYDKAEVKLKAALLPAFARLQSETALEKAMAALRSDRQALRDAAIEALGGWASIEAGQALLKAAKNASKQTDQTAALRSLAMLTRNATQAGAAERGALLKAALELKASPTADKALLSAVGTVHSGQAMHLAAKQLDRDAVRNEAAIAALQIAEQTHWAPHGAEAIARKIAGLDVNDSIKKRAEKVAKAQAETKFTAIAEGVLQDASGKAGALTGTYYKGKSFGQKKFTRRDPAVAFNWSKGSASEKLGSDHYSVRWTGKLNVPASGQYTFALRHDDGMRLWVNGQQVINGWNAGAARVSTGSVTLSEGETVPIKVEYYESSGYAVAQMGWQPPK